jgi:hypothetical protein
MDNAISYQDSLHLLNNSEWNKASVQYKASVMQSIENEVARREGRTPCNVSLFSDPPSDGKITAGYYSQGEIGINEYHLQGEPKECLNTILHEGRHAYQDQAVKGEISHHNQAEVKAWTKNTQPGNYITPEQNRRAYTQQPVEVDAREYAEITSMQILGEQKIQNNSNKGINSFIEKSAKPLDSKDVTNKGIQSYNDRLNKTDTGSASNVINSTNTESTGQSSGSGQGR